MRDGHVRIGWGMATATYPAVISPASAIARMKLDGTLVVQAGTQDIGTGTYTIMTQIAADAMGIPVDRVRFEGAADARPAPGVLDALHEADAILIAPSNPFVSIGPILAVERIRRALERRRVPCVAVSPLIGGRAVKGPAADMLQRLEGGTTPAHVTQCYAGLIDALVFDEADAEHVEAVAALGVRPVVTRTLMSDADARRRLVEAVLDAMAVA